MIFTMYYFRGNNQRWDTIISNFKGLYALDWFANRFIAQVDNGKVVYKIPICAAVFNIYVSVREEEWDMMKVKYFF